MDLGVRNPNRAAPYRFHTLTGQNTVNKVAEIMPGGTIVIHYDSPSSEVISPDDDWFKANPSLNYPASVAVADIGEGL